VEVAHADPVQLIGADFVFARQCRAVVLVARQARYGFDITFLGALGKTTGNHGI